MNLFDFGFEKYRSVANMLTQLGLTSFYTFIYSYRIGTVYLNY